MDHQASLTLDPPAQSVGSWTTVDLQFREALEISHGRITAAESPRRRSSRGRLSLE